jgi:hypothetical protein
VAKQIEAAVVDGDSIGALQSVNGLFCLDTMSEGHLRELVRRDDHFVDVGGMDPVDWAYVVSRCVLIAGFSANEVGLTQRCACGLVCAVCLVSDLCGQGKILGLDDT